MDSDRSADSDTGGGEVGSDGGARGARRPSNGSHKRRRAAPKPVLARAEFDLEEYYRREAEEVRRSLEVLRRL